MLRFVLALLATAVAAFGAAGDIQSVTIRSEGWTADVAIDGLNTGGTYAPGTGTNNVLTGSEKMVLTVVSHGYSGTTLTTKTRTVYGVAPMRKAWPNDASNEETNSGGVTTVRVILSDFIYDEDDAGAGNSGTAITATFLSGFYTSSAVPTNATGSPITVTNSSTVPFQAVVHNWSWPGYQRMDSTTKLRALAFHRHGEQYRPVNCVRFSVTDGTTTNFETVTTPTVTAGFGDELPVVEYVSTTDLTTGLTQGAELTCNFIAYPWVGDNPGDTSAGTAAPSPLVGPIKGVCDRTGAYGVTHAVVDVSAGSDPAVGSDSGKWVGNGSDPGAGGGVTAYATIGRAARAIRDYNNTNRSRDDVGGGIIFLKAGSYNWLGATISGGYGSTPKDWLTVKPFTSVARSAVSITGKSGDTNITDRVKLEGITFNTTTDTTFAGQDATWMHDCDMTTTSTAVWNTTGQVVWITQSDINSFAMGLKAFSTANVSFSLVRGCNLDGFNAGICPYTFIGNANNVTADSFSIFDTVGGQNAPRAVPIIAFNKILGLNGVGSTKLTLGDDSSNTVGLALVQNVFENYTTGEAGLATIGCSDTFEHNNYLIWHNTMVGQRCFVAYNDTGSVAYYRRYWSHVNNYFDRWANKGDNFAAQDSNRIGGWQIKFGIGFSGDYLSQNMISIPGNFYREWDGISTYEPNTSTNGLATDALFVDRKSATPSGGAAAAGTGGGDYDLQSSSPLIGRPVVSLVQYDLAGVERVSGNTAAGAFAGPTPPPPTSTINATNGTATNINIQ